MRSKILVMDEPTAGQDYKNYMNFMDAILQLPGFEAILFITHDVDLAVIFANRVLLVAGGTDRRGRLVRMMSLAMRSGWKIAHSSQPACCGKYEILASDW